MMIKYITLYYTAKLGYCWSGFVWEIMYTIREQLGLTAFLSWKSSSGFCRRGWRNWGWRPLSSVSCEKAKTLWFSIFGVLFFKGKMFPSFPPIRIWCYLSLFPLCHQQGSRCYKNLKKAFSVQEGILPAHFSPALPVTFQERAVQCKPHVWEVLAVQFCGPSRCCVGTQRSSLAGQGMASSGIAALLPWLVP